MGSLMVDKMVDILVRLEPSGQIQAHERLVLYDVGSKTTLEKKPLTSWLLTNLGYSVACDRAG